MKDCNLSEIAHRIGADFSGPDGPYQGVCIDTRHLKPGDLFVAIQGEHFDGHDYIGSAEEKGASGVVVSRLLETRLATLCVADTVQALGRLAKIHRQAFSIPVIAVTGSCGKTTVKEMLKGLLALEGSTLCAEGSLNNEIGVPLTLLQLNSEHQYAILEMGARREGDIAYLMSIADPTVVLITNAGVAHVGVFGDVYRIAKAKGEIYEHLRENGIAILNHDEPHAEAWCARLKHKQRVVTFGLKEGAEISAKNVILQAESSGFDLLTPLGLVRCQLQVGAEHNIMNALSVAAIGFALGLSVESIHKGLGQFLSVSGRLEFKKGREGLCVIDDTYNANPVSMRAALRVLASHRGKKIFVMGDMLELGEQAQIFHQEIGLEAKNQGVDAFYGVGEMTRAAIDAFGKNARHFPDKSTLIQVLLADLENDSLECLVTVLVKGSRSMQMEEIVNQLTLNLKVLSC